MEQYPQEHLEALVDSNARRSLLSGAHSLWYDHVKLLLHQALSDLDEAIAGLPTPVRTAMTTELQVEAHELRAEWAEYSTNEEHMEPQRLWYSDRPFVLFDGGMEELSRDARDRLDQTEDGITTGNELQLAVDNLRLLAEAHRRCRSAIARFEPHFLSITEDPDLPDGYFFELAAPQPSQRRTGKWTALIHRWVPNSFDEDGEVNGATSEPFLDAELASPPTVDEIADVLSLVRNQPELLASWAKIQVGDALAGTRFVVTARPDDAAQN
jgi:hypothetical protein